MSNMCKMNVIDGYAFLLNNLKVLPPVLEICDADVIVISPEMKEGHCY